MISFREFFGVVHEGREPYPWQCRLAAQLVEASAPDAITVPTGSGKTATVDALIWALASQAGRPAVERSVGVRVVWAIDRRLLVDEVHEHCTALAVRLQRAIETRDDPLRDVALGLQALKGEPEQGHDLGPPLIASRWRGGVARESISHHPFQAEVITSTIAQIGSRLLLRGYGLGSRSLTVGAGVAACDTTVCLDEAHISEPFAQTAAAIRARQRGQLGGAVRGLSLIRLSATNANPGGGEATTLDLEADDRRALAPRLEAAKQAELIFDVEPGDRQQVAALTAACVSHVESGAATTMCVCNSVRLARAVFDSLSSKGADRLDAVLIVGPQRPADRERQLTKSLEAAPGDESKASGSAGEGGHGVGMGGAHPTVREVLFQGAIPPRPLIVVGTQAIEVGLDIDVEAMVTQSASASAMVQRFGRLNRGGRLEITGHATVIRSEGFPLYDRDEPAGWTWLAGLPAAESGSSEARPRDISVACLLDNPPPPPRIALAPELTDPVIDALRCTAPRPHSLADPDVEAYLKGVDSEPQSDLAICWRADLLPGIDDEEADAYRRTLIALAPPRRSEQLTLGLSAMRNLLRALLASADVARGTALERQVLEGGDLEGDGPRERRYDKPDSDIGTERRFWVWRDRELLEGVLRAEAGIKQVRVSDLRPGDVVLVPTEVGGVDDTGLSPKSRHGTDVGVDPLEEGSPAPIRVTEGALEQMLSELGRRRSPGPQWIERTLNGIEAVARRLLGDEDRSAQTKAVAAVLKALELPEGYELEPEVFELRSLTPQTPLELAELEPDAWETPGPQLEGAVSLSDADAAGAAATDADRDEPADEEEVAASRVRGWVLVPVGGAEPRARDEVRPAGEEIPTLAEHCAAVRDRVAQFVVAGELDDRLAGALTFAADAHDLGKADPRMQAFFNGGVRPPLAEPIAKSLFGTDDRRADAAARSISGLPAGFRHEQSSVEILLDAVATDSPGLESLNEEQVELLLHLVACHHGRSHPMPPVPGEGSRPRRFHLDREGVSGGATGGAGDGWANGEPLRRFNRLGERHGPWGLAYLEALLVMADRTVSAEGN